MQTTIPKKVLVIGPNYPYRGGIATFVTHLCQLLTQKFEVKLINYSLLYPDFLFPGKTQFDESETLIFSFPNERLFGSLNPVSWLQTANAIKKFQPDVIIMDWWNPFFALCFRGLFILLPAAYKPKIIVLAENVVSHEGRAIDKILTRIGITIASAYIVLSDKVKEQIKPYAGSKPVFKSNLPIYDQFDKTPKVYSRSEVSPILTNEDYLLLFFGYIRKYKGLDIAIEAMPSILKAIPHAKLLIVGECYDAWSEYQQIIDQYQLNNHIIVVNEYVPNEDVEKYFSISDLVLLPYRSATQSGILNIAYGFQKPVVANQVGGFAEFIRNGETGLLVETCSAENFAKGVIDYHDQYRHVNIAEHLHKVRDANSFEDILDHIEGFLVKKNEQNAR